MTMRIGATIFLTAGTIGAGELAGELEGRGYHSLWLPEHSHIPASRATPFPGGEPLPDHYRRVLDSVVALTVAATATERLVVGTGISLVMQHHPIEHAKSLATLDVVSGGRARFGVGFGWNREEMANHGVDYSTRRARAREHVLAMHRLWAEPPSGDDAVSFHGEFIDFDPVWQWPKPLQQPRIPTFVGGSPGPKLFAAVAEYADGWMPIGGAGVSKALPALAEAWSAARRDRPPEVIPFGVNPTADKLEYYRNLGCTEVVFNLPSGDRDGLLRTLDELQPLVPR